MMIFLGILGNALFLIVPWSPLSNFIDKIILIVFSYLTQFNNFINFTNLIIHHIINYITIIIIVRIFYLVVNQH